MSGPFSLSQQLHEERVILERLRVGINTRVSNYVARHAQVEAYWGDGLLDELSIRLTSEVLAKSLSSESTSKTVLFQHDEPASAWQMFKRNHATSWWLRWLVDRRPVQCAPITKSETVTFKAEKWAAYPDAAIALPVETFGRPFVFSRVVAE